MNSRRDARESLVELLEPVGTLRAVYGRLPSTLVASPVAIVTSEGTVQRWSTLQSDERAQVLQVALWWLRSDDTIEGRLDDLSEQIFDLLQSVDNLAINEAASLIDYPIVDGKQYIVERILVEMW